MKYKQPRYLPGGDESLLIELGDELSIELNFLSHYLAQSIDSSNIDGIVETVPLLASLLIHYDPDRVEFSRLCREVGEIFDAAEAPGELQFASRLITIPTLYFDEWTEAARRKYRQEINPDAQDDPEAIVRLNGLDGLDHLVQVHSGTQWWCATLAFWPGTGYFIPLDRKVKLTGQKHTPPRTFTPRGSIGLGGGISGIYPVDGPGGYQIFARTPVPVWDPEQRLPDFVDRPWLFSPKDRLRFVPCSVEEYHAIEREVEANTFRIDISDYETVSLRDFSR